MSVMKEQFFQESSEMKMGLNYQLFSRTLTGRQHDSFLVVSGHSQAVLRLQLLRC